MDRNLAMEFVRVTEGAAIASARWVGKGDGKAADQAATDKMRARLNDLDISGRIVIGEGERDEAPMLFIGEEVGKGGPEIDIAVDPLECTNSVAKGIPNSIAVLCAAPKGALLHAPDVYMNKIATGPAARNVIDLDASVRENVEAVAAALGKKVSETTVMILDRPRHEDIIRQVIEAGARVNLITDGDVAAAIATALPESPIDLLLGIGAAPEGVLAASALKAIGGDIQGRLHFRNEEEKQRATKMGVTDLEKKFTAADLVKGDKCFFAATGVTTGPLLDGVNFTKRGAITNSIVMSAESGTVRYLQTRHHFGRYNSRV